MLVTNNTSFPIIAFGLDTKVGYGEYTEIPPNESKEVRGPYLGAMGGGSCHAHIEGDISCHEKPDDENGFQVVQDKPLSLQSGTRGITVRHHLDAPEPHVLEWRNANV